MNWFDLYSTIFSTSLGLIAEYIRRHHYHESVAVLQHFMPIRANDKEFEETSDSEDEEEEEKENDSTNGSDLGTWLEPDLWIKKKGTFATSPWKFSLSKVAIL